MGETEKKPKIEGRKSSWKPRNTGGSRAKVLIKFKAPTPGHEDDIFTCGQASDAANFEEVCKKLARYCAVNFKNGGTMVRKAIEEMTTPKIDPPADLPAAATKMQEKVWEADYDEHRRSYLHGMMHLSGLISYFCRTVAKMWSRRLCHRTTGIQ